MLTFAELLALDGELRETPTLTVYLDGRSENPAWRTVWRRSLRQEENRLRRTLTDASHEEREAFSRDFAALEMHLAHRRAALDAPGWLGVVARGQVKLDSPLPHATPTLGVWRHGVALAPFLAATDAESSSWVVVVDSRAARVFRCEDGHVHRVDTVRTSPPVERANGTGVAMRRSALHRAARGGVGRDAADRERREARARMLRSLATRVRALTPVMPVFVGGTPQLLADALSALEHAGVRSAVEAPALGARARVSEMTRAVREGMAQMRHAAEEHLVEDLLRRFSDDNLAAAGVANTGRALDDRAVRTLVLSASFVAMQPEAVEVFVRSALAQDATIEVVSGDAARQLEELGGAGVLLRFSPFRTAPADETALASV